MGIVIDKIIGGPLLHDHDSANDDRYVNVVGDTMTGGLNSWFSQDETVAATETITIPAGYQMVLEELFNIDGTLDVNGTLIVGSGNSDEYLDNEYVNTAGDNMTGNLGFDVASPIEKIHIAGTGKIKIGDQTDNLGGKLRVTLDDGDTEVQGIKVISMRTSGTNYGYNGTAAGAGADKNVGLYSWASAGTLNWGLWIDAGISVFDGAITMPIATVTENTTLGDTHHTVLCDATSAAFTITLPAAATSGNTGRIYYVKKIDSSDNTITIDGNASETIDGDATKVISSQYDSIQIACDGSNWFILGELNI